MSGRRRRVRDPVSCSCGTEPAGALAWSCWAALEWCLPYSCHRVEIQRDGTMAVVSANMNECAALEQNLEAGGDAEMTRLLIPLCVVSRWFRGGDAGLGGGWPLGLWVLRS
ncbi:hypothetical protein NDU88_003723 [Pleurodeles waltl]|uniref:Uncharacterized protein n=1 Tax=Pleurodeles waltl TaxID=8319 RepID=A0AAV7T5H3_PLEWA|nr:hypothetical protein NDU88_003723 [Pleurodeles waltl]